MTLFQFIVSGLLIMVFQAIVIALSFTAGKKSGASEAAILFTTVIGEKVGEFVDPKTGKMPNMD